MVNHKNSRRRKEREDELMMRGVEMKKREGAKERSDATTKDRRGEGIRMGCLSFSSNGSG